MIASQLPIKRVALNDYNSYTASLIKKIGLNTVCQSAACPNIMECFSNRTATFMIMGNNCTRNCRFCAVNKGLPEKLDKTEPDKLGQAVSLLRLRHVVITSVTRDDLPDAGANHFIECIKAINRSNPEATIEILTPDFLGNIEAIKKLSQVCVHVFNHNVETVPRLYPLVRPQADFNRSLYVLKMFKNYARNSCLIKSGFMVGLGEKFEEVSELMDALRNNGCDSLIIGQYLQPSSQHLKVHRYLEPKDFELYRLLALRKGFKNIMAGPLVRSSYKARSFVTLDKN